jgi:multidrug efflux pump subunit AcrA (membrane-fusion protein)
MTLIGKAFTAVILILSVIFMALALTVNASHRNWRDVVMTGINGEPGLKQQIESTTRINNQLRQTTEATQANLDREQAARRTALAALQTQLDQLQNDLQNSEASVQKLTAEVQVLTQTDLSRVQELERLTAENTNLRASVRKEQQDRDTLFTQTLELTDQMNKLRGFKQQLEERNEQLMAQVTRFEEVVTSKGIDINAPLDGAPPERNGIVLEVDRPRKLVLVSIGADEGLRQGHRLEVTRGGRYIGKLEIQRTTPDRAVAKILVDYSEGILQESDRVDTTIE